MQFARQRNTQVYVNISNRIVCIVGVTLFASSPNVSADDHLSEQWYPHKLPGGGVQYTKFAPPIDESVTGSTEETAKYQEAFDKWASAINELLKSSPTSNEPSDWSPPGDIETNF